MTNISIKGRLTFTPEGSEHGIDCGEATFILATDKPGKIDYSTGGLIPRGGVSVVNNSDVGMPPSVTAQIIASAKLPGALS